MGRWEHAVRHDGVAFNRWVPTLPDERLPPWGPGTALPACPVCGAEYEKRPVARLVHDDRARQRVLDVTRATPFALAHPEVDPWEGEAVPWRWAIEHDRVEHLRRDILGVDEPLERPRRTGDRGSEPSPVSRTLGLLDEAGA